MARRGGFVTGRGGFVASELALDVRCIHTPRSLCSGSQVDTIFQVFLGGPVKRRTPLGRRTRRQGALRQAYLSSPRPNVPTAPYPCGPALAL
eukprot:1036959-Prorocentrum_minimum.AAC.1